MTVISINDGELFTVRIYKSSAGQVWANTYEIQAIAGQTGTEALWTQAVDDLVRLEATLHFRAVNFDRVVVSTWVPDSRPYNPDNFTVFPVSRTGLRTPNQGVLPLTSALFVRRNAIVGRDGKLFYRGAVDAGYLASSYPIPRLSPDTISILQQELNNWFSQYHPLAGAFRLVMIGVNRANQIHIRPVVSLAVSERVVSKKLDNRWFDRVRTVTP